MMQREAQANERIDTIEEDATIGVTVRVGNKGKIDMDHTAIFLEPNTPM